MPSRSAASVTLVLRSATLAEAPPPSSARLPLPPAPLPPLWSGEASAPPAASWLACEKHRCARCRAQGPDEASAVDNQQISISDLLLQEATASTCGTPSGPAEGAPMSTAPVARRGMFSSSPLLLDGCILGIADAAPRWMVVAVSAARRERHKRQGRQLNLHTGKDYESRRQRTQHCGRTVLGRQPVTDRTGVLRQHLCPRPPCQGSKCQVFNQDSPPELAPEADGSGRPCSPAATPDRIYRWCVLVNSLAVWIMRSQRRQISARSSEQNITAGCSCTSEKGQYIPSVRSFVRRLSHRHPVRSALQSMIQSGDKGSPAVEPHHKMPPELPVQSAACSDCSMLEQHMPSHHRIA